LATEIVERLPIVPDELRSCVESDEVGNAVVRGALWDMMGVNIPPVKAHQKRET
jgi:hypothetical protein